jgi:hypothetical protein
MHARFGGGRQFGSQQRKFCIPKKHKTYKGMYNNREDTSCLSGRSPYLEKPLNINDIMHFLLILSLAIYRIN